MDWFAAFALLTVVLQLPAALILLARLLQGPGRKPPLSPQPSQPEQQGQVSVIVPTLNEVERLSPCLQGLSQQGDEVKEVLVVDSYSTDGTIDLVQAASATDSRIRLCHDDPLPSDWVGRPWALHNGYLQSSSESCWFLGIDADTQPQAQLVATLVQAAEAAEYDLVSLAPQFILKHAGEWWLQPALLITLVYRFGPAGAGEQPERVMANGQCFLCRRSLLDQLDGYSSARNSFADDVTLARNAAALGAKVGFWDGSQLIKVRMYDGFAETWREWGRSLDLKDASSRTQLWGDILFLVAVQGLPLLLLLVWAGVWLLGWPSRSVLLALGLNISLVSMRFGLLAAIASAYDFSAAQGQGIWRASWTFWLSPLADPLAVSRIIMSACQRPTQWRGRYYS